jgi:hypothetical protein
LYLAVSFDTQTRLGKEKGRTTMRNWNWMGGRIDTGVKLEKRRMCESQNGE